TAAVWVRAFLEDDFDVTPQDISWITGGVEEPRRPEKVKLNLPPDIRLQPAPKGKTLSEMLLSGEIDALVCPRAPSCYLGHGGAISRLFASPTEAAENYYLRHRIFPIMHVVGIRRDL